MYWTLGAKEENNLCIFERQILRKIFGKDKGKAVPLQAWGGSQGSRKLR
jgi:hypothetical protein